MIKDSNLMAFILFVLFCVAGKVNVFPDNLLSCSGKGILNANVTYKMIIIPKQCYAWQLVTVMM